MADDLPTVRELLARFDHLKTSRNSLADKHLALALGVHPSVVSGWRAALKRGAGRRLFLNDTSRHAIASLAHKEAAEGFRLATGRALEVAADLEAAAVIRETLAMSDEATAPAEAEPSAREKATATSVAAALTGETKQLRQGRR